MNSKSHFIPELIKDLRSKLLNSKKNSSENNLLVDRLTTIKEYCERALQSNKERR